MFLEQQNEQGISISNRTSSWINTAITWPAPWADAERHVRRHQRTATIRAKETPPSNSGIGLQLTNIVKDIQKDRLRNVHYCPTGENPHWPGPASARRGRSQLGVFSLASATISHLTGGKGIHPGPGVGLKQYKLFCVTNYLMAWKTLEACLSDPLRTAGSSSDSPDQDLTVLRLLYPAGKPRLRPVGQLFQLASRPPEKKLSDTADGHGNKILIGSGEAGIRVGSAPREPHQNDAPREANSASTVHQQAP